MALTEEEIKYYTDIGSDVKVTAEDDIDSDRWDKICYMARFDVMNRGKKREASEFNSEGEYKLYLLSMYSTVREIEAGLL